MADSIGAWQTAHDALQESWQILMLAQNQTDDPKKLKELEEQLSTVSTELDGLQGKSVNVSVPPGEVAKAIGELSKITKELKDEKKRLENATATIADIDKYLGYAVKAVAFAAKFLV